MALWPNGRYMTRSTYKGFGAAPGLDAFIKGNGDRMNRFVNASFARTASTPDGYDVRAAVPAIRAGAMTARQPVAEIAHGPSNLLQGGPMQGAGAVAAFSAAGGLSLVVSLEGNAAAVTLAADGAQLKLTIGLDGAGGFALSGGAGLALIVPFEGTGSVGGITGLADLRGLLSMAGEWTPFAELSPEGLAAAVWNSLAAQYAAGGTMGAKLNAAGSGGVDLQALAEAVWAHAQRSLSGVAPVNLVQVKGQPLQGSGSESDPWGPA